MLSTLNRQRGLTLIELMVAMLLSLMLMAGMVTVFQANKTTYKTQDGLAQLQENGRMALELLSRDLRNVGYAGCGGRNTKLTNVLNNATGYVWNFEQPLDGFEAVSSTAWSPALDSEISGKSVSPAAADVSDVLTLRIFESIGGRVTSHTSAASDIVVTGYSDIDDDDVLMVTDCDLGSVFQVTDVAVSAGSATIEHDAGAVATDGPPGNASASLAQGFTGGDVARLVVRTYFVATGSYTGARQALWLIENDGTPQELIQGIDALQVLYGRDTSGDKMVDDYVTANSVTDWTEVVAVRLNVLASSLDDNVVDGNQSYTFNGATVTAADSRLRQAFSTTVALRNIVP